MTRLSPAALLLAVVASAEIPFRVVDLTTGAESKVDLPNGRQVGLRLDSVSTVTDPVSDGVRLATAHVDVDGKRVTVECANYRLPVTAGNVQVDCTIARPYYANSNADRWGLDADARLRVWPAGSAWMPSGAIAYPVRQRWFASHTQMANEPTYVDAGESPLRKRVYYHSGLDIGGAEALVDVVAATDGLIVSLAGATLDGQAKDTPVGPRYDVVYLLDERGWYYRYSHLHSFDAALKLGDRVRQGQRLGLLGKEGGSGGWSHLHFEISSRQPSGKWGTEEGYAFLWEAYLREHRPPVLAVARPHAVSVPGRKVILDGSRSWAAGGVRSYEWIYSDGTRGTGVMTERTYAKPGTYSELLKVTSASGGIAYDFATVNVLSGNAADPLPPTIHAVYFPTEGVAAGQPVTFKVRTFRTTDGEEKWDFGDGSPGARTRSDGNVQLHAREGYALTSHTYSKPGDYIVTVTRENRHGHSATARLWVHVAE
jgi:murein DD-endopeptidase MepM/ murein hydrolase activator NlpD